MTEFNFFSRAANLSVAEIVALTGAEPSEGTDLSRLLTGIAPIDKAEADDLSFVSETKFAGLLQSTRAGAAVEAIRRSREGVARGSRGRTAADVVGSFCWARPDCQ